jgi:hypothetical protein
MKTFNRFNRRDVYLVFIIALHFYAFFRLHSIPFPTRRATFKEVKRVHETLMTIEVHIETIEEMRNKILQHQNKEGRKGRTSKNTNSKKSAKTRRSKSRESPIRDLPEFVQSLADKAKSESEPEIQSDLQEFDCSKVPKIRVKKTKNPTIELQNSLVTACKTGDLQLLTFLLEADNSKNQLGQSFGDSQFTLLHIAAREGHAKIIQILLQQDCDPTSKDKFKKTPYTYCPDKESRNAFRRYQVKSRFAFSIWKNIRGRQDHLFFDLKSNQSLDLFLLILDLRSIF